MNMKRIPAVPDCHNCRFLKRKLTARPCCRCRNMPSEWKPNYYTIKRGGK